MRMCRHWFKRGAIVLDVGTNAVSDISKKSGFRLVGDVDFAAARTEGQLRAITPVSCGVGPMTVTMLISNTIRAFKGQQETSKAQTE
jgi:5,10-methylene-tetrahydrofolate dehydrogenase/methenyl tetrahydrofolate cyclohydrolase